MTTTRKPRPPCRGCGRVRERPNSKLCDTCSARSRLNANLKYNFGITADQYDEMLARQNGVCAICRRKPGKRRLAVDHDHTCCPGRRSCGQCIRGLLCKSCNYQLLGNIAQETKKGREHARETLHRAVAYLDRTLFEPDSESA